MLRGGQATATEIEVVRISKAEEFDAAFPEIERKRVDAVILQPSLPSRRGAELALKHHMPFPCPDGSPKRAG
jgi:putative tryptophan/tyrosine transport system substrate-binding protein